MVMRDLPHSTPRWKSLGLLAWLLLASCAVRAQTGSYRIAFWNVENLFDARHDTLRNDLDFTPYGSQHWNSRKLQHKCNQIYKAIVAMGWDSLSHSEKYLPALVGLAEVENASVLRELCRGTPLRKTGYDFVHYESPDERGIDVALLYRPDLLRIAGARAIRVSDSAGGFLTRDLLSVLVITNGGDTLALFVCHLPSKRGGSLAEAHRHRIATLLRHEMDSMRLLHPQAIVLTIGDFNAAPTEPAITKGLGIAPSDSIPYRNLLGWLPRHMGTYNYQGIWTCIDQAFVSRNALDGSLALQVRDGRGQVFRHVWLLEADPVHLTDKPRRTYAGPRYMGGPSDHLPIYLTLVRQERPRNAPEGERGE